MNQEPHFRLETCSRIPGLESDCNLSNDVVEIPWKRELDPLAAHRRYIGSLAANGSAARFWRLRLGLLIDLGISRISHLRSRRSLSFRRRRSFRCRLLCSGY